MRLFKIAISLYSIVHFFWHVNIPITVPADIEHTGHSDALLLLQLRSTQMANIPFSLSVRRLLWELWHSFPFEPRNTNY